MKKYFSTLRKCALFAEIEDENLTAMLGCLNAKIHSYAKKENVFTEGDPAKNIGIVLSGAVQIERVDYYGNRSIMAKAGVGDLFGESFACAGTERVPVDVVAAEKTEIMLIDCRKIIYSCGNACAFHNQMILNLLRMVAEKNLLLSKKLEVTSKRTTREKLMTYLLLQAKQTGRSSFIIPFDRQALADYLEVDRSGLSAEITKLRKEGVLESKKNQFRLL